MYKRTINEIRYSFYLLFHPFNGFWEVKREKKGSLSTAVIFLFFFILFQLFTSRMTGFLFNSNDVSKLNMFKEVSVALTVFFLWCISNWCLTTLMEGEGSFRDIVIMTAYSLEPVILFALPLILLSNSLSLRESAFYGFLKALPILWAGFLLLVGTLTIHQYSLFRTCLTVVLIIIGMCVIAFIALLFFNLIQQIAGFIMNLYNEVSLRMN